MNMTGVALFFSVRQYQIKAQVQQQILKDLPDSSLETLRLHPADLKRLAWNNSREFFYQGEMYDLIRTEFQGDSLLLLHCLHDARETELFALMETCISKHCGNDPQTMHALKGWFELFSEIDMPAAPVLYLGPHLHGNARWAFHHHYHPPVISRFSPPPQSSRLLF